ncbi:MAG: hypothetical protein K2Y71_18655 [Xanthobacteraceae bacterium]|nr:hypothetical protein [Xanthobacteraceae bacterium]
MSTLRADGLRFFRLRRALLAVLAMATVAAFAFHAGSAVAQQKQQQPPPQQQPGPPPQVQLNPKQVEQYIAAFKELTPLFEKLDQAQGKPDPNLMNQVQAAVKKYGFNSLDEYDQVVVSIVAVLDGIDPKTRQYTNPIELIKKEIAAVQADKTMKPADRKKALEALNAELSEVQPVQHQGNIALVLKYYDQLSAVAQ